MNLKLHDLFTMAPTHHHVEHESQKEETLLRSFPVSEESRPASHKQWHLNRVVNKGDDVCLFVTLLFK